MHKRYQELDSLRGIAAMLVFIFHMLMIVPNTLVDGVVWKYVNLSPLHHLFIGDKRVIFFFILSGFVLSLSFIEKGKIFYSSYIMKRIVRLYIPYAVAITFAISSCIIFSKGGISELGGLFNVLWLESFDISLIVNHFLLIGNYNVYAYNISIWSLIHEMRIAFIFPLLMILAMRYGWKTNLAIGFGLSIIGAAIHLFLQDPYQPLYKSLFYIIMFIIGILISKNKSYIQDKYNTFSKGTKIGILIIGYLIYSYSDFIGNPLLADWLTTIGVSILLIIALMSKTLSKILRWKPFCFVGKYSYGIYLYHLPILLILLYTLYGKVDIILIFGIALLFTIIISILTFYLIEKPTIKLSRLLSSKFTNKSIRKVSIEGNQSNL